MVKVRVAQLSDANAIGQIHVATWRSTYTGLVSAAYLEALRVEKQERLWRDLLDPATKPHSSFAFVVCTEEKVVGFLGGGLSREGVNKNTGEIVAIYILAEYQGQGLGRRLMTAGACHLAEQGITGLIIWVLAGNKGAAEFYKKLGGKKVADSTMKIGGQEHVLLGYGWDSLMPLL